MMTGIKSDKIKAVIFDVDGVIIDSEPAWQKSHDEFIEKYNLDVDAKYKATFRGIGLKELILQLKEKFHLEKSVDELLEEYREIFYKNFFDSEEMKLLEGVEECVRSFYDQGFKLAVATGGHTGEEMHKILEELNLLKYFQAVVSSDEVHRGKPNPEVFLLTAQKLDVTPDECLVIEDSVNGVLAGKAAKMYVIGVNAEEGILDQLKENGADEIIKSLTGVKI